jgi:P2 family phage contractile tail tube protein
VATTASQITNANVYLDGDSFLGRADTVTLPEIKRIMTDHKGLGMVGAVKLPSSGFEALEAKIKWNSIVSDALRATLGRKTVNLQIRAVRDDVVSGGVSDEIPILITMVAIAHTTPLGEFKQNEKVMPEQTYTVYYLKLEEDGAIVFELDALANVFKIGTEDALARFRRILGA